MLLELYIKNYIIFTEGRVNFTNGFNVITGETGSGKSAIIDAIGVLCGEKFNKNDIKTGADKAIIQGLFVINDSIDIEEKLHSIGINPEEDKSILIQREVNLSGRSICRINGQTVTLTMLKTITPLLVDIVAQNEHQVLFKPSAHISFLDGFGSPEFLVKLKELSKIVSNIRNLEEYLQHLYGTAQERERKLDLLKYQIDEIDSANLDINEYEKLMNRKKILNNSEKLFNTTTLIYNELYENYENSRSVLDVIGKSLELIKSVCDIDTPLQEFKDSLEDIYYKLEDIKNPIRQYRDNIEFDSGEIQLIEERLELIDKLSRKYGETIEEILAYRNNALDEYENLKNSEKTIKKYEDNIKIMREKYLETATYISNIRHELSKTLEKMVEKELKDLNMIGAKFLVYIQVDSKRISNRGIDKVEFLLSANPGEPEKPMAKVASGGEMSRIMLAIKSVLSKYQKHETIIFDEVDAGIGGHTANAVGEKLLNISKRIQTICITHLPQIACYADNHICVKKHIEKDKTYSEIINLKDEDRIDEIVKMIAIDNDSNFSLNMAKKLLNNKKAY